MPAWVATDDAGLGGEPPELVVGRIERRAAAAGHGDRSGADVDGDGAGVDHPAQFRGCGGRVDERDVRHGEDAALVAVAPVVLEPAVERLERLGARLGVVLERILDADAERGEQQRPVEALLVHHLQAHVAVAVLGSDRLELAERVDDPLPAGVAAIPVEEGTGLGHRVERGVGDVAVDRAADEQATPAVDVGPPDRPGCAGTGPRDG